MLISGICRFSDQTYMTYTYITTTLIFIHINITSIFLTAMDCATLPHAKSTMSRCMPSNHQATIVGRYWKHIATQTDSCQLLAHTCMVRHLVDLLLTYYTNKFAINRGNTQYTTNWINGAWALVYSITVVYHRGCKQQIFISARAHAKMGHVSSTTPLLRVICHPFVKTWYFLHVYKIWQLLASAIPEI